MRTAVWAFCISLISAQVRMGDWKALTSPLNVRQVIATDDHILAATEGGLFIFDDQNYYTLTTIEGLMGVDLGAVEWDPMDQAWIGGALPFGFIQVYDLQQQRSVEVFDFGLTAIFDFEILDSLAFAWFQDGQDMGIMKFVNEQGWQYRVSYKNYPS